MLGTPTNRPMNYAITPSNENICDGPIMLESIDVLYWGACCLDSASLRDNEDERNIALNKIEQKSWTDKADPNKWYYIWSMFGKLPKEENEFSFSSFNEKLCSANVHGGKSFICTFFPSNSPSHHGSLGFDPLLETKIPLCKGNQHFHEGSQICPWWSWWHLIARGECCSIKSSFVRVNCLTWAVHTNGSSPRRMCAV